MQAVRHFSHKGLHQLQNCFVTDEDLRGQNILQSTVRYKVRFQLVTKEAKEDLQKDFDLGEYLALYAMCSKGSSERKKAPQTLWTMLVLRWMHLKS